VTVCAVPVTHTGLTHIVQNLRPRDDEEIFALRWNDNRDEFVRDYLPLMGATCVIWERDGVPVSCQGIVCIRPRVWEVFGFGTACWPSVILSMTRYATRAIMPSLLRVGFHRAECRALAVHEDSRRWIEFLGAHEEGVLKGYGRGGEDFVSYVWRRDDVLKRLQRS
jgi:RimJ/RimL family protein N-acetyltransferase